MSQSDSSSEDVVNEWLAKYEDELIHTHITPEDFLVREKLINLLTKTQMEEFQSGLKLAYAEYLRHQQSATVIDSAEMNFELNTELNTADDLESVRNAFSETFEIEKLLGKGGCGSVYLATETGESARLVALEILDQRFAQARFMREIRLTSLFSHPNLILILSSGETGGLLFYCMPYFRPIVDEGPFQGCVTLNDVLEQNKNLNVPIQEVALLMQDVVSGLETLHDPQLQEQYVNANDFQKLRQVIHRDIKPANVLLTQTPQRVMCVLADFGLAKIVDDSRDLTKGSDFLGTRNYAPPEQVVDFKSTDVRSDIYSVGATFYKFVTNRYPSDETKFAQLSNVKKSVQEVVRTNIVPKGKMNGYRCPVGCRESDIFDDKSKIR